MKQQLATMLELQGDMNTKVHAEWREQDFEWYRAIWVECAELAGSLRLEMVEKTDP